MSAADDVATGDGGQAFPKTGSYGESSGTEYDSLDRDGMTMRQHYKGQALAGLCARMGTSGYYDLEHGHAFGQSEARVAGILADAMLAEEEERGS